MVDNPDVFPEESYDPSSGFYANEFDFEPDLTYLVNLRSDGEVYAIIHAPLDFEPELFDIAHELENLVATGIFEEDFDRENPLNYDDIPDDFDYSDKHVRGPFINTEHVERFLDDSGLRGIAIPYYDREHDEFWIYINTD